jgi:hypothetical protein
LEVVTEVNEEQDDDEDLIEDEVDSNDDERAHVPRRDGDPEEGQRKRSSRTRMGLYRFLIRSHHHWFDDSKRETEQLLR